MLRQLDNNPSGEQGGRVLELNKSSTVPLYAQLAERLLTQIRARQFPEGGKIPSEHELARDFGVGRPTVRQATELLLRRGYLERRRGSGTFVRARHQAVDLFSLGGTVRSFQQQGIELGTSWVRAAARVRVCASQQHPLAGRDAFFLQRVSRVAEQPVLLESFWFDAEVFPRFDELTLEGKSLSEATFARYRMEATSAEQRFRVEALGADESKWLELSVGNAVLRVDRTLHFATARGAAFVVMHCRTDRFEFYQTIGAVDQAN